MKLGTCNKISIRRKRRVFFLKLRRGWKVISLHLVYTESFFLWSVALVRFFLIPALLPRRKCIKSSDLIFPHKGIQGQVFTDMMKCNVKRWNVGKTQKKNNLWILIYYFYQRDALEDGVQLSASFRRKRATNNFQCWDTHRLPRFYRFMADDRLRRRRLAFFFWQHAAGLSRW